MRNALRGRGKNWSRFAVLVLAMVVFAAVVFDPVFGAHGPQKRGLLLSFSRWATEYGKSGWYIVPLSIGLVAAYLADWSTLASRAKLLLFNRTAALNFALIAIAGSGAFAALLKSAIGRARPYLHDSLGAFHFEPFAFEAAMASFPSGHATTFGAVCAALALLFPRLRFLALLIAAWFGFTRVVLGVHYPSDVVGGLMFGYWFTQVTAYRFGKAGLIFDLPQAGGLTLKQSFHLIGVGRHRALARRLGIIDARLHRIIGAPRG